MNYKTVENIQPTRTLKTRSNMIIFSNTIGKMKTEILDYEVWLLNNEIARAEGVLEG